MQQPFLRVCTALAIFCFATTAAFSQARDFHTQRVVLDDNNGNKIVVQTPPGPITGGILTIPDPAGLGTFLISNPAGGTQSLAGDLLPNADSVFNLGSISNRWKELFVGGSIFTTSILAVGPNDFQGAISNSTGDINLDDNVVVTGNFNVSGNVVMTGPINLQGLISNDNGNLILDDTTVINAPSYLQGAVENSSGNLLFNDQVDITGAVTASAAGNIIGDSTNTLQLRVDGIDGGAVDARVNGDLDVTGALTVGSFSSGALGLTGDLNIGPNNFTVEAASGNTVVAGTTDLQGIVSNSLTDLTFNDNIIVYGNSDLYGSISSSTADLTLNDDVDITGNVDVGGTISSTASDLLLTDDVDIYGTLDLTGDMNINVGMFTVAAGSGNISVYGTSNLQGAISSSAGDLVLNDDVDITATLELTGDFNVGGTFAVNASTGNITVTGTSDLQGAISNSTTEINLNDDVLIAGVLMANAAGNVIGDSTDAQQLRVEGIVGGSADLSVLGDVNVTGTLFADSLHVNRVMTTDTLGAYELLFAAGDLVVGPFNFGVEGATGNTIVGGNLITQDTLLVGGATLTTNSRMTIDDGHWTSQQTTAPTAAAAGAGVATASMSEETDVAGIVEFTTSGTPGAGAQATVTFDAAYATAPIVVVSAANAAAAAEQVYVTRTTAGFTINFVGAPAASTSHEFTYQVIETQ